MRPCGSPPEILNARRGQLCDFHCPVRESSPRPGCTLPPGPEPAPQFPARILPVPECASAYSTTAVSAEFLDQTESALPAQSPEGFAPCAPASPPACVAPG